MEKKNNKGFTLIELLAVIVVLAVIALIAAPIILGIINDARDASRVRSVEAYAKAVETTVTTYMTLNPDLVADDTLICSKAADDKCLIDGTVEARDAGAPKATNAKKAVTYSGNKVVCDKVTYNQENGVVTVSKCTVGNETKYTYSGTTKDGITQDAAGGGTEG